MQLIFERGNIKSNLLIKTNLVLTILEWKNLKNIQPIDNFDWDALEKGESYGSVSKDDLVKTYDETLNTVKDKEWYGYCYCNEQT